MKFNSRLALIFSCALLQACSLAAKSSSSVTAIGNNTGATCKANSFSSKSFPIVGTQSAGNNIMDITVNGSKCGAAQYENEPCASVTICSPSDPTNCQTIDNILVDTGSYGLRIFSSLVTVPLTPITSNGTNLAECVTYGDNSSQWGQIQYAYVQLGSEPKVAVPIMTINSNYATPPAACSAAESYPSTDPASSGFNGILGVGLFSQDCGALCSQNANVGAYYTCSGSDCSCGATVSLAAQVTNPVSALPIDNNGVILKFGSVPASGAVSLNGSMYLGIDTQANNSSTGVTKYTADINGEFTTQFSAASASYIPSFIDSGSNSYIMPSPAASYGLTDCSVGHGSNWAGAFCAATPVSFTAITRSADLSASTSINFTIGDYYGFSNNGNGYKVFGEVAVSSGTNKLFDWGLPFFFGRNVYVGIEGKTSMLGAGPYWAY